MKKLTSKAILFLIVFLGLGMGKAYSQTVITGKVIAPDGLPAIGVSVYIKGTTTGTVTDINGTYSLKSLVEKATLVFTYIGFKPVEKSFEGKSVIDVTMEEAATTLDEIVVVGYGTQKKSDLTGAVTNVSGKDMKNMSVLSTAQAMQGRAAGVLVVNNSGAPGSPVSIRIRGVGGFGNGDPLYIVDGVPVKDASFGKNDNPSGIDFLSPNDIESISVLKDASSAAIYGTRGSNGVILITTKRGKSGKMKVDLENYIGTQTMPQTMSILDAPQFATLYNEVKTDNLFDALNIPNLQTTDWVNEVTRNAMVYNNQISISGGNDNSTILLSFNNYQQEGVVQNSKYGRQTFRINSDSKVNKWLKVGESLTIVNSKRDRQYEGSGGPIYSASKADPTMPVYDSTGNYSYLPRTGGSNPKAQVDLTNYTYDMFRIQGSTYAEIEFFKNFKYRLNLGMDRSWAERQEFFPSYNYSPVNQNTIPSLTLQQETWNNWVAENMLSYSFTTGKHRLDLLAGYTAQSEVYESVINFAKLPDNNPDNRYLDNKTDVGTSGGNGIEWSLVSQLARLNYAYGDKYLLTASVRRDGSSRFGANKKYGVFPSASFGWKLSDEKFFKNLSFLSSINLLKFRLGWGTVGNQNIMPYAYNGSVSPRPDAGLSANGIYLGSAKTLLPFYVDYTLSNPEVGWETNVTSNVGMDVSFWKDKLTFTLDLYNKTTQDMLMQKPLPFYFSQITPSSASWGKPYVNLGEINNKGIELSLSYRGNVGDLTYEVSANMSKVINKVVSLDGGQPPIVGNATVIKEGQALGTFYGYKVEGIFQDSMDVVNHAYQAGAGKTMPGDFKFKDMNLDGKIDAADQAYLGNAFPAFNYGFTLNMGYKGFDLNIFTQGVSGNMIYNQLRQNVLYDFTLSSNVSNDLLNYWGRTLADGSKVTNTDVPRLGVKDSNSNKRFSDYYLEDGSYFRIKTITLGYTLPDDLLNAIKLSNLRVYCTLQNLFTFTKYSGFDPEIGQSNGWGANPLDFGTDAGTYPQPKIYMLGINLSF